MTHRPRVIAFLVASPLDLLSLTALKAVFSFPSVDGNPAYLTRILSTGDDREIRDADGIAAISSIPFAEHTGPIDTLIAIGGEGTFCELSPGAIRWMHKNIARFRRVASVSSGAFMLASTGLLDGRRVTTHWRYAERLARQYPRLVLEKDPIFVRDGNVYSTAGVTAGIDMALALVEQDLGHAAAIAVARNLILYMRRPGSEAQLSTLLAQQANAGSSPMRDLPVWAKTRIRQRLDVGTLARVVAMTPRTFARQFELRFQTTPARWVQSLRVEAACGHLEGRELPLKSIAALAGFRDEQALRRAFLQQLAITPKEYRDRSAASPQLNSCSDKHHGK